VWIGRKAEEVLTRGWSKIPERLFLKEGCRFFSIDNP